MQYPDKCESIHWIRRHVQSRFLRCRQQPELDLARFHRAHVRAHVQLHLAHFHRAHRAHVCQLLLDLPVGSKIGSNTCETNHQDHAQTNQEQNDIQANVNQYRVFVAVKIRVGVCGFLWIAA